MKEDLQNLQKLLDRCIYETYEETNSDFDTKRYLEYISMRLKTLSNNL